MHYSRPAAAVLLIIPVVFSVFRHPIEADEAEPKDFPFIAVITRRRGVTIGTGTILSEIYVMTVCDKQKRSWEPREKGYSSWRIIAGTTTNDPEGRAEEQNYQIRSMVSIRNHPKCKMGGKYGNRFDASVIKVTNPFEFGNFVQPMTVMSENKKDFNAEVEKMIRAGKICTAAGWGVFKFRNGDAWDIVNELGLDFGEKSPSLRKLEYKLIDFYACSRSSSEKHDFFAWTFPDPSIDRMCGIGENKNAKLCDADEGAPLVCDGHVIGFFVQSAGCSKKWWDHPTVFTRLDMEIHDWLMYYVKLKG